MDTYYEFEEETREPVKESPFADSPYECACTYQPEMEKPVKPPKKGKGKGRKTVAILCAVALALICCGVTAGVMSWQHKQELAQLQSSMQRQLDAMQQQLDESGSGSVVVQPAVLEGMTPGAVYAQNAPAVVLINATGTVEDEYGRPAAGGSSGSGFLISQDGFIVTNYHVIQGMNEVAVYLTDGQEFAATVIGGDSNADVALLKVDGENLPTVTFGSSDGIQVGEQVIAIGYPLSSTSPSLTVGYISAKDQVIDTDGSVSTMLQTDAAINSGNSGGPLFNTAGQVIGINTAKFSGFSSTGVSIEGMSFAIPSDDIVGIIEDLQEYGYVSGAYLGVYVRDVDEHVQMYGLPAGAYVDEATPGYAAEKGGIKTGDVIICVEDYEVTSVSDLTRALRRFQPGDTVRVTVWRSGQEMELTVVLDEKPVEGAIQKTEPVAPITPENYESPFQDFWERFNEVFPFFG